jgi:6-phosphogluconate dehydrogenase (decarboxylating)
MNYSAKKIINHLLKQVYNIPIVEKKLEIDYQIAVEEYANSISVISQEDLDLIATVKKDGIAITTLEKLGIDSTAEMLKTASNLSSAIQSVSESIGDGYVVHASIDQMVNEPEILLWGLEERILRIAESYFGLPVAYQGAYLRRDIANQVQEKSRLWHIDTEDRQVFK